LAYTHFINDSVMAAACGWGNTEDDIKDYAVLIDTLGNLLDSTFLIQDIYQSTLNLCYDHKLVYMFNTYQNGQFDVYLRKLNYDLEDDTIYTMPFTYDSLCPYQIASDTIVPDDCGVIVGIEEDKETGGQGEEGKKGGLEVWPNPASVKIHVRLNMDDGRLNMDLTLVIYDIFGRKVQQIMPPEKQHEIIINLENFPSGIYLAVIKDERQNLGSAKFVVAR
jgi:hypothetical protein